MARLALLSDRSAVPLQHAYFTNDAFSCGISAVVRAQNAQ
jgi:hypothetical protein